MRKEADNSGPLTELEHWKCMSAKFNSIIEQIKGSDCRTVINILNIGRSNLLKVIFFSFLVDKPCNIYFYIYLRDFFLKRIRRGKFRYVADVLDVVIEEITDTGQKSKKQKQKTKKTLHQLALLVLIVTLINNFPRLVSKHISAS